MDWDDTIGQRIKIQMFNKAIEQKPYADKDRLMESIKRTSITVGITRSAIADVLEAEAEALSAMRVLGDYVPLDFIAGYIAAAMLVRDGKHVHE